MGALDPSLTPFIETTVAWARRHSWQPGEALRRHGPAPAHALWLVLDGAVALGIGSRQWLVPRDSAFLCPRLVTRDITAPEGAEWLTVGLNATILGRVDLLQLLSPPLLWQPEEADRQTMQSWMGCLADEVDTGGAAALIQEGLGRALVGLCWRALHAGDFLDAGDAAMPRWLAHALQRIRRQPGITVAELARETAYSPAQLRRLFNEWTGKSPHAYLQQHRMESARRLLEGTEMPVAAVAAHLGFADLSHFSRLFKRAFGLPPGEYRRLSGLNRI